VLAAARRGEAAAAEGSRLAAAWQSHVARSDVRSGENRLHTIKAVLVATLADEAENGGLR
jgi:hypothetical protein